MTFAKRESGFNFTALNPSANDYGLYQFIPSTLESTIKLYQTKPDQIEIIKKNFDLTPKGIIEYLGLREPIYTKTTNYGHFGKPELPCVYCGGRSNSHQLVLFKDPF